VSEKVQVHLGSAVIGFAIILVVVGAIYALSAARFQSASSGYSDNPAVVLERIGPAGTVVLAGSGETAPAAAAPVGEVSPGEAIYNKACVACHASGVAGAPKLGDQAGWEPRLALGVDGLLQSAINGKNAMPPRGTCMDCSDDDLKTAIEFMLSTVGAAPAAEPVPAPAAEAAVAPEPTAAAEVDLAAGEGIYSRACVACHATGVAGAPKLGDQAAWGPRVAQGMDAMLATAVNGRGAMPPRGTCMDCSDDDLKAAIAYMVSQAQ
jgi:cytochrome c5